MTSRRDFETKKSVHINLTKSTHSELRIILLRKGLSMQEVFDNLASRICDRESHLCGILDEIERDKRERQIKKVSKSDSESIFNLIESDNPFE
jgi:uncharacterized small protein (DUF1192 family)